MGQRTLIVQPADNVVVALQDLKAGEEILVGGNQITLLDDVKAKHKFLLSDLKKGDKIIMYGVLVAIANEDLLKGNVITTANVHHAASGFEVRDSHFNWQAPDTTRWQDRKFMGYHRSDGKVGVANYWLVIPMVFCENRNVEVMRQALTQALGYKSHDKYNDFAHRLSSLYKAGKSTAEILDADFNGADEGLEEPLLPNIDGVKFLTHQGGCGGIRQDSVTLCGLLAGYITHPNVAGATVLSLGCQNAQVSILMDEIKKRDAGFNKPLFLLDQQQIGKETDLLALAIKKTFAGMVDASKQQRQPASLDKLVLGLECGGSDGFSGISANPAVGYCSDLLVGLGGSVILAEFPELCGVEQNLSDRCKDEGDAKRFAALMGMYSQRATEAGSGFDMNPSPGNIKDGLITDAIKSAGAAKKGGTSPVAAVLDYPEPVTRPGLNLLCTPGNDVESTTAEVGSGASIVLFTTGLGTPTGNPIAPVVKLATNTPLYQKMTDIIDLNMGTIIEGTETIEQAGARILDFVCEVASGKKVRAVINGQDDFIPWKRGISL
ncbi:altronate hydrolase [Arachidicoccus rhizosphaerae]|uniref:Altronate hydrolase n=1 Tax=Arachidicoccus rhizosphaerae TaxID=551991 RepID=A0A1H4AQL2_9BACT|nr:altronate dehydratase family protein [Arachidicoccus rhizosphaerae]SEA38230.1 altronate hydrolase [Arachidicoccus rhizosphaerae]